MLRRLERRLARVEESIPVPITPERFVTRARQHAKRSGGTLESSIESIVRELSDEDLVSLARKSEEVLFGSNAAARDAARRKALEGYPDWTREAAIKWMEQA